MALDDLNKGLEKDPDLTLCRFARGDVYFQKADYQKAVEDYTIGLARKPNIEALSRRAEAYEKLGEKQKALADFQAILRLAPSDKRALDGLARFDN